MIDIGSLLSAKVREMKPSGIRRFFDIANELDDVISLGIGEPDFKTPWAIRKAGMESLEQSKTFYTANSGLIKLREEIAEYLQIKTIYYMMSHYINPLLRTGQLKMTMPEKPKSKNQKYYSGEGMLW